MTLDIKKYKRIYMVGIGGISMSGIALILKKWNYEVSGSDGVSSHQTEWLINNGIHVNIGQVSENITKDIDLVVYTAAVKLDNPELVRAKELGIPIVERGEFLGEITKLFKDTIGIAGTHGKTSTTSMVTCSFIEAGLDPSIQVGANLKVLDNTNVFNDIQLYNNSFLFCKREKYFLFYKWEKVWYDKKKQTRKGVLL